MNSLYFESANKIDLWKHNLPHWEQERKMQFVTFRLADSLPYSVRNELQDAKRRFYEKYPHPWNEEIEKLYYKSVGGNIEKWLDAGLGSCILRSKDMRKIVITAIEHVNRKRTDILGYVVMPNHVHILHVPFENETSGRIIGSIRQYSARIINKAINRSGALWQKECFDRLIRSELHFQYSLRYIIENPRNLPKTDYTLGGRLVNYLIERRM